MEITFSNKLAGVLFIIVSILFLPIACLFLVIPFSFNLPDSGVLLSLVVGIIMLIVSFLFIIQILKSFSPVSIKIENEILYGYKGFFLAIDPKKPTSIPLNDALFKRQKTQPYLFNIEVHDMNNSKNKMVIPIVSITPRIVSGDNMDKFFDTLLSYLPDNLTTEMARFTMGMMKKSERKTFLDDIIAIIKKKEEEINNAQS